MESGPGHAGPTTVPVTVRFGSLTAQPINVTGSNSSAGRVTTAQLRIGEFGFPGAIVGARSATPPFELRSVVAAHTT